MIKNFNINKIFEYFFKFILISLLLYMIADFSTVYYHYESAKFIYLDERRIFLEQNSLRIFGLITLIFVILLFSPFFKNYKIGKDMLFLLVSFIISYLYGGFEIRPMFFYGIILTLFIYDFYPQKLKNGIEIDNNLILFFVKTISIFAFLPLLIWGIHYIFTSNEYFNFDYAPQLFIVDTFRGLTLDRIQYSFIVGILFLIVYFNRTIIKYNKLLLLLCVIALFLSMARAIILALFISFIYSQINNKKIIFRFLLLCIFFILIVSLISLRMEIFKDGGNRIELLITSISMILDNGIINFLFGAGNFYTVILGIHQPHNLILQSIMDFGIIVFILWLIVIYNFFKKLNRNAQSLFIYLFSFGMFHVGFSTFLFVPMTVLGYVLIIILNRKELIIENTIS